MRANSKTKGNSGASAKGVQWVLSILVVLLVLIGCVVLYFIAERNTDTVSVVMWAGNNYQNGKVTSSDVVEYKMQRGEFENYAIDTETGSSRRLILWEDVEQIYGCFCTRNVYGGTLVMTDDLMYSRIDNSDMIMYNFPGREIIALDIVDKDINEFKTFLQPGDTINVTAVITEEREMIPEEGEDVTSNNRNSSMETTVEVVVTEPLLDNIYVADMLNSQSESVLDLMVYYDSLSASQQAYLDNDDAWQQRITAETILVALTKEEILRYYEYEGKSNVTFKLSLPQR